ncbi:hypothetical protein [Rhodococcus sp. IEGM 1379]|uniref:hypothetical protein n=1 Tax=Rhodococcus sp. IEGM 1379 TaxID=3047086 RepID=UPI0024B7A57F|nr:hypothetical protein [Rhodococcus sp. IEGM 1379]MDI9915981.1 hypothetical protein [Rhodococcus sp. IEGM 1379]
MLTTFNRFRFNSFRILLSVLAGVILATTATTQAHAAPTESQYLDLPEINQDGTSAGGLNPTLPLDRSELKSALSSARNSGIDPSRYATLLRQYWLVVGAENANIELANWDPQRGLAANRTTIDDVYVNYLRMTNAHPELYWSGMAGLAGVSFASGFYDLGDASTILSVNGVHQLADAAAGVVAAFPPGTTSPLPSDLQLLITQGPHTDSGDIDWYVTRLLTMQKHIFMDLVPMHEAYIALGSKGIEEFERAGLFDDNISQAWQGISEGTPDSLADALIRMASREQNQVIADQWDTTTQGRGSIGRVLTYVTTVAGKPAVPGTPAPGTYAPIEVTVNLAGARTAVTAPLPAFNWADREPRWSFIADELAPSYITAVQQHSRETQAILANPFTEMSARGRLIPRLPDLLYDLTTGWELQPA